MSVESISDPLELRSARRKRDVKTDIDRLPPHALESEQFVIGCALTYPILVDRITLQKSDFYDLRHQETLRVCRELRSQTKTFDLVSVYQKLRDEKLLEQCGGIEYLNLCQDIVSSPENLDQHCKIVAEKSELRKIIQTCTSVVSRIYDHPGDVEELKFAVQSDLGEVFENSRDALKFISAPKFVAGESTAPPQVIHGVLHAGSKMAVGGASKSFKTWSLLDVALSVSTGTDWLDFHTTAGKVLFLNFEIQDYSWQSRIKKVAQAKKIETNDNLVLCNLRGHAEDFRTLIPKIIQRCQNENYSLIILDPIYKIYGQTDENSARDTAALLNSLEDLANQTGAAVAFAAHFAKGNASGKNAIDRISGSGVFARDPDSILVFTEHESENAFTIEPILRNFPHVPKFSVRWNFPLMTPAGDLDPARLKQSSGRKKDHDPVKLLALIRNNDAANPISSSAWAGLAEMPRKTLTGYLAEMRRSGWIKTVGEGTKSKQIITNEGKAFIAK
jgi:hypothetical protein